MDLTASDITKEALLHLKSLSHEVWRQNNNRAVPGRTFTGRKGLPDIQGYNKIDGTAVYCEVKSKSDKMRPEQVEFLNAAKKAGCLCYTAKDVKGKVELKEWEII